MIGLDRSTHSDYRAQHRPTQSKIQSQTFIDKLARLTVLWICEFENRGTAMLAKRLLSEYYFQCVLIVLTADGTNVVIFEHFTFLFVSASMICLCKGFVLRF